MTQTVKEIMNITDDPFMAEAMRQAEIASASQEVPVGAVIIYQGKIIAARGNAVITQKDPTAHAEMLALRDACRYLQSERLVGCALYVTLEPCPMCAQAIAFARVKSLFFGAYDPKGGGVEHGPRIFDQPSCHHRPEICGGLQESANAEFLRIFFAQRREG